MVMLPIAIVYDFNVDGLFVAFLIINMVSHAMIDHAKANWGIINLIEDQLMHIMIIFLNWVLFIIGR